MIIEGSFYRLTPLNDHSPHFDLELLYKVGGKNPRSEFKIAGYGYNLDHAIKAIIRYAVNQHFGDQVVTLKQYLDEYRKAAEDIKRSIQDKIDL